MARDKSENKIVDQEVYGNISEDATSYTIKELNDSTSYTIKELNDSTSYSVKELSKELDKTPSFTGSELSDEPQVIKVQEVITKDDTGKVTGSTLTKKYIEVPKKPKNFSYGTGNITAKEYAENIWGKRTTSEDVEMIAKIFHDKKYDKEADAGSYMINTENTSKAKRVGQYIGERGGQYSKKYINKLGGSVTGNVNEGILFGKELAEKTKNIKQFANEIDKDLREEIRQNIETDDVQNIKEKLNNRQVLTNDEKEKFVKAKTTFMNAHNKFIEARDKNGFDKNENIYSQFDKDDSVGNSKLFKSRVDNNVTYQSLKRNKDLLDYDFKKDESGNITITGSKGSYNDSFEVKENYLETAKKYQDYEDSMKSVYGSDTEKAIKYLEENKDAVYDENVEKLLKITKGNDILRPEDSEVLRAIAATHANKIDQNGEVVNNLKLAAKESADFYDINLENTKYLPRNGAKGFELEVSDELYSISNKSINFLTDDERKKYEKIIKNPSVGKEDLSEIADIVNRRYRENKVLEDISSHNKTYSFNSDDVDYSISQESVISNVLQEGKEDIYYVNKTGKKREKKYEKKRIKTGEKNITFVNPELNNNINNIGEVSVSTPFKFEKKDNINSFEDIRKGASSNYNRITGSYAQEEYGTYALSKDEVLEKSGIKDKKIREEILGAKKFDDLSPEAIGALYGADNKLNNTDINLGNFLKDPSNQDIEAIERMNPELGKKLRNISSEDKIALLGKAREEVANHLGLNKDGLPTKLEMKRNASLDINDPKVARRVLEDLSKKNPEVALADLIDFTGNRKGYRDLRGGGQANQILDAFRKGTLEKDLREGRLEKAYGIIRDTIDEIKKIHGKDFAKEYDQFDAKTNNIKDKYSVENMKRQAKNFTKEDLDRIDSAFDRGLEATAKRTKELSEPLTRKTGKFGNMKFGGKTLLTGLGVGLLFGAGMMASNASEERERKRQEMNQLLAQQSMAIRGGY